MCLINKNLYEKALVFPNKIAVKDDDMSITYSELMSYITNLSHFFTSIGVKPQNRIAILLPNSINYIICIYAILNCEAVFVPLPYDSPIIRVWEIIEDCRPQIIITNQKLYNELMSQPMVVNQKFAVIDEMMEVERCNWNEFIDDETYMLFSEERKEKLAYIVYTSGSTGKPKGVAIRYKSLVNFIKNTVSTFLLDCYTNYIGMLPFNFDGAFGGIFAPLWCGGTFIIYRRNLVMPKKLIAKLQMESISFFGCTPALFNLLVHYLDRSTAQKLSLKIVSIGGDFISKESVKKFYELFDNIKLYNRYGPTETTSVASGYQIKIEDVYLKTPFPIGKPENGVLFRALKEDGTLIKENETGELYIGGCQVMAGYWNDIKLTQQSILKIDNEYYYKTNDYVTITNNGDYILLGRKNNMIKRNGYRIFNTEIEQQLMKLKEIRECVCIEYNGQIVAFCIREVENDCEPDYVFEKLKEIVPIYMIPNRIIFIDKLPLNKIAARWPAEAVAQFSIV